MDLRRLAGPRRRDLLALGLALGVTLIAARGHFSLPLDVANSSMKSTGTPAAAAAQREREFGRESTLLVLLEPGDPGRSAAPEEPAVAAWRAELAAWPAVARVHVLPASGPAGTVLALEVAGEGEVVEEILDRLPATAPPDHRLSVTGPMAGEIAIARALQAEQARVVPAILATLAAVLLLLYRRPALVLAALLPGLAAILWLGGVQHLLGLSVNPVSALLAPVILVVGVAGTVHAIERYLDLGTAGVDPVFAPGRAMRELAVPLALSAATTMAGFLALTMRSIPAVQRFGLLAALGVLLAFLATILLVPSWLRLAAGRNRPGGPRASGDRRGGIERAYVRHLRRATPWLVGGVALASLYLADRGAGLRADTEPLRILPPHHPFRAQTERVAARIGGIETFEVLLPAPQPAWAPLRAAALAAELGREPLVQSLAGPPRRSEAGSLFLGVLLRPGGTAAREALFARVEASALRAGFPNARITGPAVLVAQDSEALVREQRGGFLAMLAVLGIFLAVGFRSWQLGLVGLIPNVIPAAVLYGGLALAGRSLSVATTMIATVLLGLIVDNTIHFLHAFVAGRRRGMPGPEAIVHALGVAGRPIVISSAILALGFAAALVGRLETTLEFAALSSLTIVLALVGDIVVLPALLLPGWRAEIHPSSPPALPEPCAETTT
ncbi:MAG: MMPL family transporter [Planctomycetota bacterium]